MSRASGRPSSPSSRCRSRRHAARRSRTWGEGHSTCPASRLAEQTACIGDTYAIGDTLIQVTGPRYPCWKIERRWGIAGLTARVAAAGRTGWYCRVLQEGMIEPGMAITLVERPYPRWTVMLTNDFGHGRNQDVETARALATCPLLNEFWQELVLRRAMGEE